MITNNNGIIFDRWVCHSCEKEMYAGSPFFEIEKGMDVICNECAFIHGIINSDEYKKTVQCIGVKDWHPSIVDGAIFISIGKSKKDITSKDYRNSNEYRYWRDEVFKRDDFTCQCCGKKGGSINAHHIKKYKDFPSLRTTVSNGVTLCETCHRAIHKHERTR